MKDVFLAIFSSASKIVLLALTMTACTLTFMKIMDPKDFLILIGMVYGYYFASKPNPNPNDPTYGGK